MGDKSAIEWTDATWNPLVGCTRVSEGCRNCYAERDAIRINGAGQKYEGVVRSTKDGPRWTGVVRLVEKDLDLPLRWKKPRRIFVNSMSDLFHERVPDEWIDRIFAVMALAPQHTFQVLTKRPERMREWELGRGDRLAALLLKWTERGGRRWPFEGIKALPRGDEAYRPAYLTVGAPLPDVWLGVSVEDQATADARIPLLLQTPAALRWVSYEPALESVDFGAWLKPCEICGGTGIATDLAALTYGGAFRKPCPLHNLKPRLDWLVVGGESGPGARPFDLAWARSVITQGRAAGVPVFVKQLGAVPTGEWGKYEPVPLIRETATCGWVHALRDRKGGDWTEWPEDLSVRDYPKEAR